ncbi:FecCD family ABC transporter permease [Actinoalloteichus fjordicus]|uniref:ABC-type enterobactin transport system, permease component n=1 Tax=Actinoalloteichus fjordicus TaxID=1612552 RepID=A0AAC9LFN0_9PSEU|nr:iron chelate uptake ABC transporter family permease subunit [Actinoalloteichus fjordicus]APU15902.1 ABC-type enterobactin transport system, permease component [Actinoalloteichus fjordicus]
MTTSSRPRRPADVDVAAEPVDGGRAVAVPTSRRTLRPADDRWSIRFDPRTVVVGLGLSALLLMLTAALIATGDRAFTLAEVASLVTGQGGPPGGEFVVRILRLPRALTAVLVGVALGVAGAVLQSVSRNALGSPDVVGFSSGAATGAVVQIVLFGGSAAAIAGGALLGALVASAIVYAAAYRNGMLGGRLVVVGVAVSALLAACNQYLVVRAEITEAHRAMVWLAGSLTARTWDHVWLVLPAVALLVPAAILLGRRLALLEMGEDLAVALGVPSARTRLLLLVIAVGLTATATAAAGPIAFVALAAPHLARALTRSADGVLLTSGLTGAVLLVCADLLGQRLFAPAPVPVGLITGVLGGGYLVVLLMRARGGASR